MYVQALDTRTTWSRTLARLMFSVDVWTSLTGARQATAHWVPATWSSKCAQNMQACACSTWVAVFLSGYFLYNPEWMYKRNTYCLITVCEMFEKMSSKFVRCLKAWAAYSTTDSGSSCHLIKIKLLICGIVGVFFEARFLFLLRVQPVLSSMPPPSAMLQTKWEWTFLLEWGITFMKRSIKIHSAFKLHSVAAKWSRF